MTMLEPRTHLLKIHPGPFAAVASGRKGHELRRDDRGFQVGERLLLQEWDLAHGYTGREMLRTIAHITRNGSACWGLLDDYVVLGLVEATHPAEADLQRLGGLLHDLAELLGVKPAVGGGIEEETILTAAKRLRAKAGEDPRLVQALELTREDHASWMLGSAPKARDCSAEAARLLAALLDGRA
jgi:hypothetical protein